MNRFMKQMDEKMKRQTNRSKCQTLPRIPGDISARPKPTGEYVADFWGFA